MDDARLLTFYLHWDVRKRASRGRHNFISKICSVVQRAGFDVAFDKSDEETLLQSAARPGYAMFHMDDPFHDRALTMRRVYQYPFWAIEQTAKRWDWSVARSVFDPASVPADKAARFFSFWAKRQFGDAPDRARREGYVYVPLQGRLLAQRSFQSASPVEMLESVLAHDPDRPVAATLHPKESYSDQERTALSRLQDRFPRLMVSSGGMEQHLQNCDYVVTQNSSAAFFGYFFKKPAVLFGRIDFHHIAASVSRLGAAEAIARAPQMQPDYAAYLFWFWQEQSINAGLDTAEDRIRARLAAAGWPV